MKDTKGKQLQNDAVLTLFFPKHPVLQQTNGMVASLPKVETWWQDIVVFFIN